MILQELEVCGMRNLLPQRLTFPKRVTVIFGQNGQGKTSVLEAIFLLSQNRSFRTSQIRDVVSRNAEDGRARVCGRVKSRLGEREITLEIHKGRRSLLLDGKKAEAAGQFFGQLRVVTFTPEELQLVKGAPLLRRQFLDRTLSLVHPAYIFHLVHYQRAIKQRNAVLGKSLVRDEELVPWEDLLIQHGQEIALLRQSFLRSIGPSCEKFYRQLCENSEAAQSERVSLEYESDFLEAEHLLANDTLQRQYESKRAQEKRLRATQFGVHKDDIRIVFSCEEVSGLARSIASQGQTRTLALALKLAAISYIQEITDELPILLLDDVESELDAQRRQGLFEFLKNSEHQVLITTTDPSWAPSHRELDVENLEICSGLIKSRSKD